jgi:hypothetical protein
MKNTIIMVNKTEQPHTLNVRYVHRQRRSRKNSL